MLSVFYCRAFCFFHVALGKGFRTVGCFCWIFRIKRKKVHNFCLYIYIFWIYNNGFRLVWSNVICFTEFVLLFVWSCDELCVMDFTFHFTLAMLFGFLRPEWKMKTMKERKQKSWCWFLEQKQQKLHSSCTVVLINLYTLVELVWERKKKICQVCKLMSTSIY